MDYEVLVGAHCLQIDRQLDRIEDLRRRENLPVVAVLSEDRLRLDAYASSYDAP